MTSKKILIFGIGNVGRSDDGLGIRLSVDLEKEKPLENVTYDANYQLNVEDAYEMSQYDLVIFADASLKAKAPFQIEELAPAAEIQFSTHAMSPGSILALCQELYNKSPKTYLLTMPGHSFDIGDCLTKEATANLNEAKGFVLDFVGKFLRGEEIGGLGASSDSDSVKELQP